jgi:uncharacterized membrane protein YfcA
MIDSLPLGLSWAELLIILAAAFSTSVLHTVSGFAGGVVLAILIAPIVGVETIVPLMTVVLLISATSRLWAFRRAVNWRIYRQVMVTGLPCIAIGAVIYGYLPGRAISGLLGVFLIATVLARRGLEQRKIEVRPVGFMSMGVLFGLLSGSTIGAGMMLIPLYLGAGLMGESLVAMIASVGFTMNVTKTLVFASSTILDWETLLLGAMIGICTIPGTYSGYWIVRKTPMRIHTMLVEALVVLGGGYFIYLAVS